MDRTARRMPVLAAIVGQLAAALVISICLVPTAVAADKATDDFNLGVGFYRDQRWQLAADTFDQFVTEFPDHERTSLARVYLGLSLSSLEQYGRAREQFAANLKVVPNGPNAADVRYRLGECSYYLKEYQTAIEQLQAYLDQHPEHSLNDWAQLFIGDSHNELNQSEEAEGVLRALLGSEPNNKVVSDAKFGLARALEAQQKRTEAFQLYREVSVDSGSVFAPRALARIGAMYFNQKQFSDAARVYDDIIARFPSSPQAQNAPLNSGLALYRNREFEKSLERLSSIADDSPLIAQSVVLQAMALKELGRADEARDAFNAALTAAGDTPLATDILFQQAQMERSEGRKADAAQIFEDIADRWPNDDRVADCLFNAIDLRIEVGDADRAERLWARLTRDIPAYAARPQSQILNGRLLLALGQSESAITVLKQVVSSTPDTATRNGAVARYLLAKASFDERDYSTTVTLAKQIAPLVDQQQFSDIRDVLVLGAVAATNASMNEDARQLADLYLLIPGSAAQRADALAARTVALAGLREYEKSLEDARTLASEYPGRQESWNAILSSANLARENSAWSDAEQLFRVAADNKSDAAIRETALTGVAISLYRAGSFTESQAAFEDAIAESTDSDNEAHLRYLMADAAAQAGQAEQSASLYYDVFDRFTPRDAAEDNRPETATRLKYAYDAGKQAARLLGETEKPDRADAVWQELAAAYPNAADADAVLDEWGHMNLQRESYARADEIHQQLLDRFPDSDFAGMAHLSLAESAILAGETAQATAAFEAILSNESYHDLEKSNALFHLIDIAVAGGNWTTAKELATQFESSYPRHELLPRVQLFLAEASLNVGDVAKARDAAEALRQAVLNDSVNLGMLAERVWLILGRAALETAAYDQVDGLAAELEQRFPDTQFAFQMRDLQGRRWMMQAPPDFDKAREYFKRVVDDPHGRGSRTAASCQLRIADTLRRQQKLPEAVREYYRLYYNHSGHDDLRVEALYAAAVCERDLNETVSAIRSLRDLVAKFPDSARKDDAVKELQAMGATVEPSP